MIIQKIRNEYGQAMLEMAVVLPLLLLMFMGIFDFGRVMAAKLAVSNMVRETVRLAAVAEDVDAVNGAVSSADDGLVISLGVNMTTFESVVYTVNTADDSVKVSFIGTIDFVTPIIPFLNGFFGKSIDHTTFPINTSAIMKWENGS